MSCLDSSLAIMYANKAVSHDTPDPVLMGNLCDVSDYLVCTNVFAEAAMESANGVHPQSQLWLC